MPKGVPKAGFRMTKNRLQSGGKNTTVADFVENPVNAKFTVNERFGFIEDMINMVVARKQASVIISGGGGLGKSYSVYKALEKTGLKNLADYAEFEVDDVVDRSTTYTLIKGYSTAKGLFRTLYENRNGIVVMDDTDSIFKDVNSLNLLKAALDSYDRRIITYNADIRDDDLPNTFEYKGGIIFLTNIPSCLLDQAIISRSMVVDLSMTVSQKIERMFHIISDPQFMSEVSPAYKKESIELIQSVQDEIKDLSMRTLVQVINIRNSNQSNWKRLAEYVICN